MENEFRAIAAYCLKWFPYFVMIPNYFQFTTIPDVDRYSIIGIWNEKLDCRSCSHYPLSASLIWKINQTKPLKTRFEWFTASIELSLLTEGWMHGMFFHFSFRWSCYSVFGKDVFHCFVQIKCPFEPFIRPFCIVWFINIQMNGKEKIVEIVPAVSVINVLSNILFWSRCNDRWVRIQYVVMWRMYSRQNPRWKSKWEITKQNESE